MWPKFPSSETPGTRGHQGEPGKKRLGLITLSLSSFVPKAFTPFQWVPFLEVPELKNA